MLCFLEISSALFLFEYDIETFYTIIHANRERFIKGVAHDFNDRNWAVIRKSGGPNFGLQKSRKKKSCNLLNRTAQFHQLRLKFDESIKAADGIQKIKLSKRWGTFANEGLKYLFREETVFKYRRLQASCLKQSFHEIENCLKVRKNLFKI